MTSGGRVLDRALSVLPEERAGQVRKQVRAVAKRVIG
jgi:hypothetical protein